jgi:hypothetical protein
LGVLPWLLKDEGIFLYSFLLVAEHILNAFDFIYSAIDDIGDKNAF